MKLKYSHKLIFGFFSMLFAVVVALGACVFALTAEAAQSVRLTVVIDAGHGGVDGGVVGVETGVKESDVNLDIARRLQRVMEEAGFQVVQTRETEAGLYGTATAGYKMRDMKKRAQIIQKSAPALVISIHQNFFSLRTRRGAQVFFREGNEASETLACSIQTKLNAMEECVKRTNALRGDYYILNCSSYPSVIVECGFLSNAEDEKLLMTDGYRDRLAETIALGAIAFLLASS